MKPIVTHYARMWPREVYDFRGKIGQRFIKEDIDDALGKPGVYVLYREEKPYYIGKTGGSLSGRIYAHANQSNDPYYNFWNFFSAFIVPDKDHLDEVEAILIASMPTANAAKPIMRRISIPKRVASALRRHRRIVVGKESEAEDDSR